MAKPTKGRHPEASLYRRNAARITSRTVLHELEKKTELAKVPPFKRAARKELADAWGAEERMAATETMALLAEIRTSVQEFGAALDALAATRVPELIGPIETEQQRVQLAVSHLADASEALSVNDFGTAGASIEEAERELWLVGGPLVVTLNGALQRAAVGKEQRQLLEGNLAERRQAKVHLEAAKSSPDKLLAAAGLRRLDAAGLQLAAGILANQVRRETVDVVSASVGRDTSIRVVPPQELETFSDIGGLEDVKERLRATVGTMLERPDEAARYRVVHNGILFHGPPGTGKNLLSRAIAGEYGMRYLRFSPAAIASSYIHEAAANLSKLFELAKDNTPCVLFLDEIDTIAADRSDEPSSEHREVITQLMISLEEYRKVPGLLICAATNELDRLDPALREGRFDAKILVPLPDREARAEIFRVHLQPRGDAVEWDGIDFEDLADRTQSDNAAALEVIVSLAAQRALQASEPIGQAHLVAAIEERGGKDRITVEDRITWDDVVLGDETREQLMELLTVFTNEEMARRLGVKLPAGVLLYGPPGTGKTTIARAMASQIKASFYEQSAADLVSKWAGESEQKVAKMFERARANRPSIIFIDEIDSLLRTRSADTSSKWEERVLSQFLRELDGLRGGEGVFLVGASNRIDVVDEAIVGRRLVPIEVGLPDAIGRLQLLRLLCRDANLAEDVNPREIASLTEGMSGADLKHLCNAAGMKALTRAARATGTEGAAETEEIAVSGADFKAAIAAQRARSSLVGV